MKVGPSEVYESYRDLIADAEAFLWERFGSFFIGNLLLLLIWGLFFTADGNSTWGRIVMTLLSILGVILGLLWADLGRRGRIWLERCRSAARGLEDHPHENDWWEDEVVLRERPFQMTGQVDRCLSSAILLVYVPLSFSLLHVILLVGAWVGGY